MNKGQVEAMTENEAIDKLNNLHYKIVHTSFCNKVYESEIEALCMAKDCLKEIQQYRAIGTVEEFKTLKEKKNFLPIATITFSKEQPQEIVDEKIGEAELDIQKIRAKAIDEFAEKLSLEISESIIWDMLATMNKNGSLSDTSDEIVDYVIDASKKIAEQMKAGVNNE